ncbi:MAG TPA: prenyltransferase/squalene oxidase repeat-containing protein [Pirellulales bacterium]|nr:prenyltransferase/squalene oxidase repeat-containing protein [Pirellulales bacterium]
MSTSLPNPSGLPLRPTAVGGRASAPPVEVPRAVIAPPPKATTASECVVPARSRGSRVLRWIGRRQAPLFSFVISTLVHAVLLLVMGLWSMHVTRQAAGLSLVAAISPTASGPELGELPELATPVVAPRPPVLQQQIAAPRLENVALADMRRGGLKTDRPLRPGAGPGGEGESTGTDAGFVGTAGALTGRSGQMKSKLLDSEGGNLDSEQAVKRGLGWLAAHQLPSGAWRFNHQGAPCSGACGNPGNEPSTTASTALGLLCFLGAGHTDRQGDYQEVVRNAMYYLAGRMQPTPHGGDFMEGTMYGQGLSAMALAEAYAMTHDPALKDKAQAAIDFVVYAQDQHGGGWRYAPGEPGDVTVTGWMFMALRSGQMSYLKIPGATVQRGIRFLDAMSSDYGSFYGYLAPGKEPTSTAVGLLCRMVTGWRRDDRRLAKGVRWLSQRGPSKFDMYYNYYATQVLHHWGGSDWQQWNRQMRYQLIATQAREGHESGSWFFKDDQKSSNKGGRLYATCMAIMTLEVYYRYLPLYGKRTVDASF